MLGIVSRICPVAYRVTVMNVAIASIMTGLNTDLITRTLSLPARGWLGSQVDNRGGALCSLALFLCGAILSGMAWMVTASRRLERLGVGGVASKTLRLRAGGHLVRKEKSRVKELLGVGCLGLLLVGCVGAAGEVQWRYHEQYTLTQKNRKSIADLRTGMSEDEVRALLGEPEMVESYPRETIWYYRTDLTAGVLASVDADFTPLLFNDQKRLTAWGKGQVLGRSYRTPMVGTLP
jgi:hypothetical protein